MNTFSFNIGKTQSPEFRLRLDIENYYNVTFPSQLLLSAILMLSLLVKMFLLRKLKVIFRVDVLFSVFFVHFKSHLINIMFVWENVSNVKKCLILQDIDISIICRNNSVYHCKPLYKILNMRTVTSLYNLES